MRTGYPGGARLPIAPLRRVVQRDAERVTIDTDNPSATSGVYVLADQTGLPGRSLKRILTEQQHVSVDFADRYCCATNRHISMLYPELYE